MCSGLNPNQRIRINQDTSIIFNPDFFISSQRKDGFSCLMYQASYHLSHFSEYYMCKTQKKEDIPLQNIFLTLLEIKISYICAF